MNMKSYQKTLAGIIAGLALLGIALAVSGCGGSTGSSANYSVVSTSFSGANITYEYPKGYQMPPGGAGDTSITYMHYLGKVESYNADAMFFIETSNLTTGHTASMLLDQDVTSIIQNTTEFHLIRRAPVKVDGASGEMLAFSASFQTTPLTSENNTTWVAYVARGDRVWQLGVMANTDLGATAENEYKHLISTFTFN